MNSQRWLYANGGPFHLAGTRIYREADCSLSYECPHCGRRPVPRHLEGELAKYAGRVSTSSEIVPIAATREFEAARNLAPLQVQFQRSRMAWRTVCMTALPNRNRSRFSWWVTSAEQRWITFP
jgi:hypothetical protein